MQNCGIPAGRDAILIGPSTRIRIIKDDIIMTKKQDVKVWDFKRSGCVGHSRRRQGYGGPRRTQRVKRNYNSS